MTTYYPVSYLPGSKAVVAMPTPEAMDFFNLKPWEYGDPLINWEWGVYHVQYEVDTHKWRSAAYLATGTRRSEWFKSYAEALNYLNHITKS